MNKVSFRVDGIDCAACALSVRERLLRNKAIKEVVVGETIRLEYDDTLSLNDVAKAIKEAGATVPKETIILTIDGTEPPTEAQKASVLAIAGVVSLDVDKDKVTVTLWPIGVNYEEIQKKLPHTRILETKGGAEESEQTKQVALLRRLSLAVLLTMPLMWNPSPITQLILGTLVQFGPGLLFYRGALRGIKSKSLNMDFLVASSTTVIYLYSCYLTLTVKEDIKLYFLSQCVLISLILFGKYLELLAKQRMAKSIKGLLRLQPHDVLVEKPEGIVTIPVEEVRLGDTVVIRSGDRVSVDGVILEGSCVVDESLLTGESALVNKTTGDHVVGGTLNRSGNVRVSVTAIGEKTELQQIIAIVRRAQSSRAPVQDFADKIASIFIPIVLAIALIVFFVRYGFFGTLQPALLDACAVLVVACPCALGLAIPTSILVGVGRAADLGVLFRGGAELEHAWKVNTVVFDKTGTLTEGCPHVQKCQQVDTTLPLAETLSLLSALEARSSHPAAEAIVAYAKEQGWVQQTHQVTNIEEHIGQGIAGVVDGRAVCCGTEAYLAEQHVAGSSFPSLSSSSSSSLACGIDGKLCCTFALDDTPRGEAAKTVEHLKAMGLEVWMMTGDKQPVAEMIGKQLGIKHILSSIRPEEKADAITKLKQQGAFVAMVGNGVNDAPALEVSDIGIAMGTGTDIAMESAGVLLLGGRLENLPLVFHLSKAVMHTIRENLCWALLYNGIGIPLAALGILNPSLAAAMMSASSITVLLNALRLQKEKKLQ